MFMGQAPDIPMQHFPAPPLESFWIFALFGVLFGILGFMFNRYLVSFLNYFGKLNSKSFWKHVVISAAVIGILLQVYPDATGGGYIFAPRVLAFQVPVLALFLLFFIRMIGVWIFCGMGAPGGLLEPMLALGICMGMWFGWFAHLWFPALILEPGVFAVAGMGALLAATVGAPLTGIVIVVEMTMNYALILPLIITCFSASMTSYILGGSPLYEILLERTLSLDEKKRKEQITNNAVPK